MTKKRTPSSTSKVRPTTPKVTGGGRESLGLGKLFKAAKKRIGDIEKAALAAIAKGGAMSKTEGTPSHDALQERVLERPSVRLAVPADTAGVRACILAAFEHYVPRIGKRPAPMLLEFEAEIQAGHVWLLADAGDVVGALVQYETELGFYIDTVGVAPSSQGKGYGRALLECAEQEALRRGYQAVYLCTNSKMIENQVFYPRLGYVEYERKHDAGYDRVFYRKELAVR